MIRRMNFDRSMLPGRDFSLRIQRFLLPRKISLKFCEAAVASGTTYALTPIAPPTTQLVREFARNKFSDQSRRTHIVMESP